MKKLTLLLIIIGFKCIAQDVNYERFSIVNTKIIWQNIYQKDSLFSIETLKKIPSLKFTSSNIAEVKNQRLSCKGLAIYMNSTFDFNVLVEEKESKIRITITDIVFNSNMQVTVGYVTAAQKYVTLEEAEVRTSDSQFRRNSQSKTNLECLDSFLQEYFKTKISNNW
jgi:hypothetical protein